MSFFGEIGKMVGIDQLKAALGYTIVSFNGDAVYVDGIVKVLSYDPELILVDTRGALLEFTGRLAIESLDENAMIIRGSIKNIREMDKEKHARKKEKDKR